MNLVRHLITRARAPTPGRKRSVTTCVAAVVVFGSMVPAFAQVVGDPDGNVAIGTEGENVSARYAAVSNGGDAFARNVAVSNGGNASTWPAESVALSTTGTAHGYLAASATGCAVSDVGVALSVTGCATGWRVGASGTGWSDSSYLAASGTQCAHSTTVGVSATGCAQGWITGASVTGNATGGMTAVSGTGSTDSGIVGVSGGRAYGYTAAVSAGNDASTSSPSGVAVSGTGTASGTTALSVNTTWDDATGLAADVAETTEAIVNTGLALTESPAQTQLVATSPPDPVGVADKLAQEALIAPDVAYNMATGLLEGEGSMSTMTASSGPPKRYLLNFPAIAQTYRNTCVPTSVLMILTHRGMSNPGEAGLGQEMKTSKTGVSLRAAAPVFDRYYTGPDTIYYKNPKDATQLMNMVTTDTWYYNHGLVIGTDPTAAGYWPQLYTQNGNQRVKVKVNHAVAAFGYDHRGGGKLVFMDPWDVNRFHSWDTSQTPNSLGAHEIPLSKVYAGMRADSSTYPGVAW